MRSPADIRSGILRIRDKNHMPMPLIVERSRCSRDEIICAFRLEASESTLRRLDAFLDAPKLHRRKRGTKLLYQIERLGNELWREFAIKSKKAEWLEEKDRDRQLQYWELLNFLGKQALQKRMREAHSIDVKVPDGEPYWLYKERCRRRLERTQAIRTGNTNTDCFPWPCAASEVRQGKPR